MTKPRSIKQELSDAGYRVEPRKSSHIGTHGQRAIVRKSDGKWMGDYYAHDAHAAFVVQGVS